MVTENFTERLADDYVCKNCSYKAIHQKDLSRHESQMHGTTEEPQVFGCDKCDYSTQYDYRLKKHCQIKHAQQSRYFFSSSRTGGSQKTSSAKLGESFSDNFLPCNSCDFKTKIIDELRSHKEEHKQSKQKSKEESHGNSKRVCLFNLI